MFEEDIYAQATIEGHETATKTRVTTFVDSFELDNASDLNKLKLHLHEAVSYVQDNLPTGVDRVDGYVIQPILNLVISEKIAKLPQPESEEV